MNGFVRVSGYSKSDLDNQYAAGRSSMASSISTGSINAYANNGQTTRSMTVPKAGYLFATVTGPLGSNMNYSDGSVTVNGSTIIRGAGVAMVSVTAGANVVCWAKNGNSSDEGSVTSAAYYVVWDH